MIGNISFNSNIDKNLSQLKPDNHPLNNFKLILIKHFTDLGHSPEELNELISNTETLLKGGSRIRESNLSKMFEASKGVELLSNLMDIKGES